METFDILGSLASAAYANGWKFAAGDNFYQNMELLDAELLPAELTLTCTSFNITPSIVNGRIMGARYESVILLGRKTDATGEEASLDETYIQKHNRRLKELMTLLAAFIADFACDNELDIVSFLLNTEINKFDTNIDFVGGRITLTL